jgi:HK97 family phage major capsid protein
VSNKISDKFGRLEATAFMVGTGVKMPRGLLTYPAGTTNPGQIEQIHSGDANLVTADSLIRISFSVKEPYMANARFLMQRTTVASVMLLKDTQQRYLWQPFYIASQPASLVGYPIAWAADMPAIAAGATPIAFGDFRQAYTIVDRLGISTLRDPFTAKPFVLFYKRRRVGGDVVNFEAYKLLLIGV